MFFKKTKKDIGVRKREMYTLIFFGVSFFIYGTVSLYFYVHPSLDPLLGRTPNPSDAPVILAGIFFLYGVAGFITKRSIVGRVFSSMVVAESIVVAAWRLLFTDVSTQTTRLSGAIEGFTCFGILVLLMIATRKGASIWQ